MDTVLLGGGGVVSMQCTWEIHLGVECIETVSFKKIPLCAYTRVETSNGEYDDMVSLTWLDVGLKDTSPLKRNDMLELSSGPFEEHTSVALICKKYDK